MPVMTPDEQAIVDATADFARKRIAPKALEWDLDNHFPKDVIRESAQMGVAAIYTSEEHGGSGMRRLDGVRIFEELSRGCAATAAYLSIHNMCTWMIDEFGTDTQRAEWIPKLATMELFASYCLTEPGAGSDAAALSTKAVRDGEDYVLTGTKQFISGAGDSDLYVVMARTGEAGPKGISTFIVTADMPGVDFGPNEKKMGWHAQATRQVILDQVRVPASNLIGETEGTGFTIAMRGLNGGRINIAACSLGAATEAYSKAVSYVREREAFGQSLADQPTVRFALAEMATKLEASRQMLWRAARALDDKDPDHVELCAMAKMFVTETCWDVADQALQLFGGYGYLHEYGVEKIQRDLRVHRILEGTNEIMRMVVGRTAATRGLGA
ncbi:MAG TPA: acyl-CoA dehydrogenase family protein [Dietzia timorensis]|uniref:Acyl-CoA dehydrogenase family protein n=1 Tax=Dietzia timorensis TaxID=499555 RepID=A0A921JXL5_9ACTN|nr:acyl-CoA dehydrogenase family protein [Dietzia timorensis]HJE90274.1 acyl-CoA dehydrogenase family protein [Dietzia timorensis]